MDITQVERALEAGDMMPRGAAVLVPLLERSDGLHVLFEVRAHNLAVQPGEVCLPGGRMEPGESALRAAIRETCEELLVSERQLDVLGSLGSFEGPGGRALHAFVARVCGYEDTFSPDEVDKTFTIPLQWLLEHDPEQFVVTLEPRYPDDYPWELVPGGRGYPWRARTNVVPFYRDTNPMVWGATARILVRLTEVLRTRS